MGYAAYSEGTLQRLCLPQAAAKQVLMSSSQPRNLFINDRLCYFPSTLCHCLPVGRNRPAL
jgi:hypothetical protein